MRIQDLELGSTEEAFYVRLQKISLLLLLHRQRILTHEHYLLPEPRTLQLQHT